MYIMDPNHTLHTGSDIDSLDKPTLAKMSFIFNAINDGWTARKRRDKYVFTRPHDNRKEVFENAYLEAFIKRNICITSNSK
jgi:hypothetical protein